MATVLYLTANPQTAATSASLRVGEEFINAYKEANPSDQVEHLDLITAEYNDLDYTVMGAIQKLMSGADFSALTSEEQGAMAGRQAILDQFLKADKIIFVTPMWEYSFPAVVKKYLDTVTAPGVTFRYTENGNPIGLLKDAGKKVLHIQASGGIHTQEVVDQAHEQSEDLKFYDNYGEKHLRGVMNFIGIFDYTHLYITGQALPTKEESIQASIAEAKALATTF